MIAPKTNDLIIEVSSNSFDDDSEPAPKPTEPENTWSPTKLTTIIVHSLRLSRNSTTEVPPTTSHLLPPRLVPAILQLQRLLPPRLQPPRVHLPTATYHQANHPTTEAPTTQPPVVKNQCKITKCLRALKKKKCKGWEVVEKSNKGHKNHWKPLWTKFNCEGY